MLNSNIIVRVVVRFMLVIVLMLTVTMSGCMIGAGEAVYKTEIGVKGFKFQPGLPNVSARGKDGATFSSRSYGECGNGLDALGAAVK